MTEKDLITKENLSLPWYCNTITISILMLLGGLILRWYIGALFIAVGVVCLILQHKIYKITFNKANSICDIEEMKKHSIDEINFIEKESTLRIQRTQSNSEQRLKELEETIVNKNTSLTEVETKIKKAEEQLLQLNGEIEVTYISPYSFNENIKSEEYKNKLTMLKMKEKEYMMSDNCIKGSKYVYNELSDREYRRKEKNERNQLLRCFNAESEHIIANVTVRNVDTCRSKLQKMFDSVNKIFETTGIRLGDKCLKYKLDELSLIYDYKLKIEQERELQKEIRAQLLEEEKVRKEIEEAKKRLDKEEKQFRNEISKLMGYLHKASEVEKQLYIDKIHELDEKLKALEKDRANVLEREQNTRAGFVYVISNIGSFGENIYKIGMTRRLEPMDRINELSTASVPFPFDVHAIIFSADAPALEAILHKTFKKHAVNKVNYRKEFYKIDLKEVERVVKNNHNATVLFTMQPEAEQYYETLQIEKHIK